MISNQPRPPNWQNYAYRAKWWLVFPPIEWALEWLSYWWSGLAIFKLLELGGRVTVLVAIVVWFTEADSRRTAKEYRAWELIAAAAGKSGDLGRRNALEALNAMGVSLAGAPLSRATLPQIDLRGANLSGADLRDAVLWGAGLLKADLGGADLSGANLSGAILSGAYLLGADLRGADLSGAILNEANMIGARLFETNLSEAKFENTTMPDGNSKTGTGPPPDWHFVPTSYLD